MPQRRVTQRNDWGGTPERYFLPSSSRRVEKMLPAYAYDASGYPECGWRLWEIGTGAGAGGSEQIGVYNRMGFVKGD